MTQVNLHSDHAPTECIHASAGKLIAGTCQDSTKLKMTGTLDDFRLCHPSDSNQCFFSQSDSNGGGIGFCCGASDYADSHWQFVPISGQTNKYLLKNKHSGKCVFNNRNPDRPPSHYACHPEYSDQWWIMDGICDVSHGSVSVGGCLTGTTGTEGGTTAGGTSGGTSGGAASNTTSDETAGGAEGGGEGGAAGGAEGGTTEENKKKGPDVVLIIGSIVGGLFLLIMLALFIRSRRQPEIEYVDY